MAYHKLQEEIVDIITAKTQSNNRHFFRILTAYYFAKLASMMRANVVTQDRGTLPINLYALNLAVSGTGKGFSMNIFEETLTSGFRQQFLEEIFPRIADKHISKLATVRAVRDSTTAEEWADRLEAEFETLGVLAFSFDSGTPAAIKQMRQKLLLANAGSMNLEIDEISSNFTGNMDVLTTFLELYDKGKIKQKLTKNTKENTRFEEIFGETPTNLMLFGTPVKLLDGSKTEDDFKEMLEIGYARRLLIGFSTHAMHNHHKDAVALFDALTDKSLNQSVSRIKAYITSLATPGDFNRLIQVNKDETLQYLDYKLQCEAESSELPLHEETRKTEWAHRYFKVIKLAGAYAFMDKASHLTNEHIDNAITLVEDSGAQFVQLLQKEGTYIKLAKYLATVGREVTHVDLIENLPFYKGSKSDKTELVDLAAAYGYQNNIIIRRKDIQGIEFISGESLQETNLEKITISFSQDIVKNFVKQEVAFTDLHKLVSAKGFHYCAHAFVNGYRDKKHAISGFNLLILDVDHGLEMITAMSLLDQYTYLMATTKSHTEAHNRYRIIFPLSHFVKLDMKDYAKFMENVFSWLPFNVDTATKDIARKWESAKGQYEYNSGDLVDATEFIPQTQKAAHNSKEILNQSSMTNMERWFSRQIEVGNRNSLMLRYGYILMDSGASASNAIEMLEKFNTQLKNPLDEDEIQRTIGLSLLKKEAANDH